MAKLQENYLNLIRNALYTEENTRVRSYAAPLKNKPMVKKQTQAHSGFQTKEKTNNTRNLNHNILIKPCRKAKHVAFVRRNQFNSVLGTAKISGMTEKVNVDLDSKTVASNLKKKQSKRPLSIIDASRPIVKRRRERGSNKSLDKNRHKNSNGNNDWSILTLLSNVTPKSKLGLTNNKDNVCGVFLPCLQNSYSDGNTGLSTTEIETEIDGLIKSESTSHSKPKPEPKPGRGKLKEIKHFKKGAFQKCLLNSSQKFLSTTEDAADIYANKEIISKDLKFKQYCNLFPPTNNEHLQKLNNTSMLSMKYEILGTDAISRAISNVKRSVNSVNENINGILRSDSDSKQLGLNNECSKEVQNPNTRKEWKDITSKKKRNKKINTTFDVQNSSPKCNNYYESQQSLLNARLNVAFLGDSIIDIKELLNTNSLENNQQVVSPATIITLKDGCIIVLLEQQNQIVYFNGLCYLKVLNGEIEILGAYLNRDSEEQKVYSPRGTSLLYMRNHSKSYVTSQVEPRVELKKLVPEELLTEYDMDLNFDKHCAILLCRQLKEPYIEFIERLISQKIFPDNGDAVPRIDFELSGRFNKIRDSDTWRDLLENVSEDTKIVICGGKGVGKSTFLRYAVNVLLRNFKKIRIVDLDPGQSEFCAPGFICMTTVENYMLGPNYTHLQSADKLILSHINMGYMVGQYLKSVKHLVESVEIMDSLPTLINFPGYTQGLGLNIAATTLQLFLPTDVIEFKSTNHSKNYKMDMTPENVNSILQSSTVIHDEETKTGGTFLNYKFVKLESLSETNEAWSLEGRQAREICILSYFGKTMADNVTSLLDTALNMFCVNISAVNITSFDGRITSPLAINANLVALCSANASEPEILVAWGYGIVRGMDLKTDTLVLLTPESMETLENVNHLVLSSITTPPSLIMSGDVKEHVPFISVGDLIDFGQFTKRSYLPPRKLTLPYKMC